MFFPKLAALCAIVLAPPSFAANDSLTINASGIPGSDGQRGFDRIGSAMDGYRGFNGGRGGDGQRGQDGGQAGQATNGRGGGSIALRLSLDPSQPGKLLYSGTQNGNVVSGALDLDANTSVLLLARGGRGGNGACGGSGQDGGRGGEGGDADQYHFSSGDGGRGGDGGNAGDSSNGADGGAGGRIVLQLAKGQEDLARYVHAEVNGGFAGQAPSCYVRAGRGGQGGQPGNQCFYSPEGYKCVSRGMNGMNGMDGRSSFSSPRPGSAGAAGSFVVEVRE